jgi:hypothetical protein
MAKRIISKNDIEMNSEIAYAYLLEKNYEQFGYLKYCVFKRTISHAIKTDSEYSLRKVFMCLVEYGFIEKKKNKRRSYNYIFVNPNKKKNNSKYIIDY